jgi:ankyrin repeat protein
MALPGPQNTLYAACADEKCTVQQVEGLLKAGGNPDQLFEGKGAPLDAAVEKQNLSKIHLLLKYGASATKYTLTPVVKAMLQEDLLELQRLAKTDSDFKTGFCGFTPLRIAIALHDWDYFYLLLLKDIPPKTVDEIIELMVRFEINDLVRIPGANRYGPWKTRFECFLKVYVEPGMPYYYSKDGLLCTKDEYGRALELKSSMITLLLEHLGYFENKLHHMPSLLEVTKPNRHFRERTHLKSAIRNQDVNAVKFLLNQAQIDVNHPRDSPPLHTAIWKHNYEIVNLLLSHTKINVNVETQERQTPFLCYLKCKEYLSEKLVDLEKKLPCITLESKKNRTKRVNLNQPPISLSPHSVDTDEEDDNLMAAVLPRGAAPIQRVDFSRWAYKQLFKLPESKIQQQEILGGSHPDSEEAEIKLEAYWRVEIENEKQEIAKKIATIQNQIDDTSIADALISHPGICLKPRIYFSPQCCDKTIIHRFGYPERNLVKGKELWLACFEGDLSQVESHLTEPNIDINYYLNVASTPWHSVNRHNNEGWISPDMFEHNGTTPLHVACSLGFDRIVECLLQHHDIDINLPKLDYEERRSVADDVYLMGVVSNQITPLALGSNSEIHRMLFNHDTFDVERNLEAHRIHLDPPTHFPLFQLLSFFTKHQASPSIRKFCSSQLVKFHSAKSDVLSKEELSVFKKLLDLGVEFEYQFVDNDDPELVSLLIRNKLDHALSAFQHFVSKACYKSARLIARLFSWEKARNLCKNKRLIPNIEARRFLYSYRVKPVESWALKSLESSLNLNTCFRISQFLFEV